MAEPGTATPASVDAADAHDRKARLAPGCGASGDAPSGGRPALAPVDATVPNRVTWWRRGLAVADAALDLVFPPMCVGCYGLVDDDGPFRCLCARCAGRLVLVESPHCTTCGYPIFGERADDYLCPHCETLEPAFGEGRTAALLQGPLRRLVHGLKYEQALHVLADVTTLVRRHDHFRGFLDGAVLVPVPLHPRKLRDRGYNQAELLARAFAAAAPMSVVRPLLTRRADTGSQTRLDRAARLANLKNAFALAKGAPVEPAARHVLIDDVFTTGATLNACATVLRQAGVRQVDVATLGHG